MFNVVVVTVYFSYLLRILGLLVRVQGQILCIKWERISSNTGTYDGERWTIDFNRNFNKEVIS